MILFLVALIALLAFFLIGLGIPFVKFILYLQSTSNHLLLLEYVHISCAVGCLGLADCGFLDLSGSQEACGCLGITNCGFLSHNCLSNYSCLGLSGLNLAN